MQEYRVPFDGHLTLCGPSAAENPDGADYLRVSDADDTQVAFTTSGRLRADGVGEMTRIMDALTGGRSAHTGELTDPDWGGPECVLVTAKGLRLHIAAAGTDVDYLRVVDQAGEELVYWNADEWVEDPELVIGAFLGSLNIR